MLCRLAFVLIFTIPPNAFHCDTMKGPVFRHFRNIFICFYGHYKQISCYFYYLSGPNSIFSKKKKRNVIFCYIKHWPSLSPLFFLRNPSFESTEIDIHIARSENKQKTFDDAPEEQHNLDRRQWHWAVKTVPILQTCTAIFGKFILSE